MGVDIHENARRRENRRKNDDVLPEDYYTNPHHEVSSHKTVTRDQAWDKPNFLSDAIRQDGSIDINSSVSSIEKVLRDADKGIAFGLGKDGKLDGKELRGLVESFSKDHGLDIPADLRASLNQMCQDPNTKLDIKEGMDQMRDFLSKMDKNHDGGVSPKEMMADMSKAPKER